MRPISLVIPLVVLLIANGAQSLSYYISPRTLGICPQLPEIIETGLAMYRDAAGLMDWIIENPNLDIPQEDALRVGKQLFTKAFGRNETRAYLGDLDTPDWITHLRRIRGMHIPMVSPGGRPSSHKVLDRFSSMAEYRRSMTGDDDEGMIEIFCDLERFHVPYHLWPTIHPTISTIRLCEEANVDGFSSTQQSENFTETCNSPSPPSTVQVSTFNFLPNRLIRPKP